jgi:hypothetical protein
VNTQSPDKALLQLIDRRLREGASIEIGGIGSFHHDRNNQIVFNPTGEPLVFLAYAREDRNKVKRLFRHLQKAGLEPWMDCQTLLAGQNWPRAIEQTIEISDFFLGCFSKNSISKRGQFQSELAFALNVASRFPEGEIFFIPVRLDDCTLPRNISSTTHWVDLFPNWTRGTQKLIAAIRRQHAARRAKPSEPRG